ncbi:purine nucleoside permease [Cercophora newfieldiana]|uniref:Purine nucleoside permease n=1 Tax=Cercophora newfieldiana TaxID=92897 RepID=A0AA39YCP6_9PEZI|nr:purine nucleoside permease [Cercophora newfieldiana]
MFEPEAEVWYRNMPSSGLGNLLAVNISTPGLSMLFPHVHCLADYSVCQVTTGEAEINAAATTMALLLSQSFDFRGTYFLLSGIAGVNPKHSTLGGVALARYAVQVALQHELDAREMPDNFTTGYFPYGRSQPNQYTANVYGTEVMELNAELRDMAYTLALKSDLVDSPDATKYRAKYKDLESCTSATLKPSVVKCDTATSDVYYSGTLLSEAFENITEVWTNGTGKYCMTAQEDNAVLEVLVRMAVPRLVDFSRVIVMRTGSNFDRPPPGVSAYEHLVVLHQNGFQLAIQNLFNAGIEIVKGILEGWDNTFEKGVKPTNYVGDIFGSLGGQPDFGLGSLIGGRGVEGEFGHLTRQAPGKRAM